MKIIISTMKKYYKMIALMFIALSLFIPSFIYFYQFGGQLLSKNQSVWGDFGSYVSGISTPIFSLLTLVILYSQLEVQKITNKLQAKKDKLNEDLVFVQTARDDARLYLSELKAELLTGKRDEKHFVEKLTREFSNKSIEELGSEALYITANEMNEQKPRVAAIWMNFCGTLGLLGAKNDYPYTHNLVNAKNEAFMTFPYKTCCALDNFMWCYTKGSIDYDFKYSDTVKKVK